ncbi:pentraxin fusion protein-like [Haliotis asinina]|uniref:pentraxin fusion protein-like n=1 Tax=Haliotis asinina TaxID=109174 RepID=UPI0035318D73
MAVYHKVGSEGEMVLEVMVLNYSLTSACELDLQYGKRQTGSTFKISTPSSLFSCAAECVSYRVCKSFNFDVARRTCHLNGCDDLQCLEGSKKETDFIYSSIINWNKTALGRCQDNPCAFKHRCSVQRNGALRCDEELSNIAKNKPAYASSTYNRRVRADAAVDGKVTAIWSSRSCFTVAIGDMSPWWLVDLADVYIIVEVDVTSRKDCCPDRLHDFALEGFEADPRYHPNITRQLCYMYNDTVTEPGKTVTIHCVSPVSGRYLRLSGKKRRDALDVLQFCEVQVFGFKIKYCWS